MPSFPYFIDSRFSVVLLAALLVGCGSRLNDPYPAGEAGSNTFFTAFTERPKHLDPVQSYTEDEIIFTAQIYAPPLQYHYLKRPYTLVPYTVEKLPAPRYFDAAGQELPDDAPIEKIAESLYALELKKGIFYAPHPAFAKDVAGNPLFLGSDTAKNRFQISDFPAVATRELKAADYVYQIKRLAHPKLHSPIFGMMSEHIEGLADLAKNLQTAARDLPAGGWLDLDQFPLAGVQVVDDYRWQIRIKGKYPQFLYWLSMAFFAPIPREADRFFSQPGMAEKNLSLDGWPVGTGPYQLAENDPNRRMVLVRNPNFQGETYPCEGEDEDKAAGLLADCGKKIPFIDRVVFSREKESIPYWSKFLQGYYDASGISSDSFDQAVRVGAGGDIAISDEMKANGISLLSSVKASTYYLGFNLLDPAVGGYTEKAAKLRQAISIAIDQEEFISIFLNGRGIPAHSPLPPGIFGFDAGEDGMNHAVYDWTDGRARRKNIAHAKALLAAAGYPNGRHEKTGDALIIYLDTTTGGMGDKSRLDWLRRQFSKIDLQLDIRSTDFNRFQDKLRQGAVQLFFLGWNADYPDPENFFFLLEGKGARVGGNGENSSNYSHPEFDRSFAAMKNMDNNPERLTLIRQMNRRLQVDAPWVFAFHPKSYTLIHHWLKNRKPHEVSNNTLKYQRIDSAARVAAQNAWNRPLLLPLFPLIFLVFVIFGGAYVAWYRREKQKIFEAPSPL